MVTHDGWIKWYRSSLGHALFKDPYGWHLWQYCCLKANHNNQKILFNNQIVHISRGQFVFGRKESSRETGIKEATVYRRLKLLEKLEMLSIQANNKFSIITIRNYDEYQYQKGRGEQQKDSQRTTSEQQVNTNKNVKNVRIKKHICSLAEEIYENHPRKGARSGAIKNIVTLLNKGVLPERLRHAQENYKRELKRRNTDKDYIIQANNFFGKASRWLEFADIKENEDEKEYRQFMEKHFGQSKD